MFRDPSKDQKLLDIEEASEVNTMHINTLEKRWGKGGVVSRGPEAEQNVDV